jgi:hypothetical protein
MISNPNVKLWSEDEFPIYAYKGGIKVGSFYYGDKNRIIVDDAVLSYADRDVTITGSSLNDNGEWTNARNYNLYLKKGWNMMFFTSVTLENKKIYTEYLTTTEPSGLKWYFVVAE